MKTGSRLIDHFYDVVSVRVHRCPNTYFLTSSRRRPIVENNNYCITKINFIPQLLSLFVRCNEHHEIEEEIPIIRMLNARTLSNFSRSQLTRGNVKSEKCEVEWPILILRGNGDVFVLIASLENKKKIRIDGPLSIYPRNDDNYGIEDASSLIVLKSTPPIVVVATCNGNVYHSMLLNLNDYGENSSESVELDDSVSYQTNSGLYMFECIELELGISLDESAELYSSPVNLHADPYVPSRYFCTHEAGLHAVILPIVLDLDKYAKCDEDDADQYLPSLRQSQSSIEYLICTRLNGDTSSEQCASPLIGYRITELPSYFIAFSISGDLIMLPLTSATLVHKSKTDETTVATDDDPLQMDSFNVYIESILKPNGGSSRPVLKLDPNVSQTSDSYTEILTQEIDNLREEYFGRYQDAIKELEKRIKLLSVMKEKQNNEAVETKKKYEDIQKKETVLRRICDELLTKQTTFETRVKSVLDKVKKAQPKNTATRKRMVEKLKEYNSIVQELIVKVDELSKKHEYQDGKMQEVDLTMRMNDLFLNEDQQKIIEDNLRRMGEDILELKKKHENIMKVTVELTEKFEKK